MPLMMSLMQILSLTGSNILILLFIVQLPSETLHDPFARHSMLLFRPVKVYPVLQEHRPVDWYVVLVVMHVPYAQLGGGPQSVEALV